MPMVWLYETEPALFEAVIVNLVLVAAAVGVPEITPVVVSMVSPAGSAGVTEYARFRRHLLLPVNLQTSLVLVVHPSEKDDEEKPAELEKPDTSLVQVVLVSWTQ
jgi:hypothetical protein